MATAAEIQTAYKALYRVDLNATVAASIAGSGISLDAYIAGQLPNVASTTQAAVAIASFVTGIAPSSAKLDELKVAADAQVASYTKLGVANPALGAFEAFGRSFATDTTTTAAFTAKYGALSTADFIGVVYGAVYGSSATAAAAANLTAQIDYFTALFTANNVANASIAAKGAVLGQIVGYAFTSSASANSNLDNQVQSLLTSASKGDTTVYSKALPAAVDPGQTGVTINFTTAADVIGPGVADPALKSTGFNDTINGAVTATNKIDAGGGDDTANLSYTTADFTVATGQLVSVETLTLDSKTAGKFFDLNDKVVGLKSVGFLNSTDTGEIKNILAGTALTVSDTNTANATSKDATFTFKDFSGLSDVASLTVNGIDTAAVKVTVTGIETLNLTSTGASNTFRLTDAALTTLNITAAKDVSIDLQDAVALNTITNTGSANTTLTAVKDTVVTIDGSTGSGNFSVADVGNNALTIKGGSGVDTFGDIQKNGAVVTTGAGNDAITFNLQNPSDTAKVTGGLGGDAINLTGGKITAIYTAQGDSTASNTDSLTNFTSGSDKIDLSALKLAGVVSNIGTFTSVPALADLGDYFGGKAVTVGDAGGVNYVLVDVDNNGKFNFGTDMAIKINTTALVTADFIFV